MNISNITPISQELPIFIVGAGSKQMQEYTKVLESKFPHVKVIGQVFRSRQPEYEIQGASHYHIQNIEDLTDVDGLKIWLAEKKCSTAVVVLPHNLHAEAVQRLSALGIKTILKDKPFATTEEELIELNNLKNRGVNVFTLTQREFSLANRDALKALSKIGQVQSFEYLYDGKFPKTSGWRADPAQALGGVSLDMGAHLFQVVAMFFEGVPTIKSEVFYTYPEMAEKKLEDRIEAILTYPNFEGRVIISSYAAQKKEQFVIQGTEGIMRITPSGYSIEDLRGNRIENNNSFPDVSNAKQFTQEFMFRSLLSNDSSLREENLDTNARAVLMYAQMKEARDGTVKKLSVIGF